MSRPLVTHAPAKINLSLHVLGRRADGYHTLESLVAFAGTGDTLRLEPGPDLSLTVEGPTAGQAGASQDNLVLKAARLLSERVRGLRLGAFRLTKRLPVAAGIGGGSSDAAAALRLLARLNNLSLDQPAIREAARLTGADVPVCLEPRARMMRGAGEDLGPPLKLPRLHAVLVNPRVPLETPKVFKGLGLQPGETVASGGHPDLPRGALTAEDLLELLRSARNDLEPPARLLEPSVDEALAILRATRGCRLARMSGSGATVFALYDNRAAAVEAGKATTRARPDWWVKPAALR